MTTTPANQNEPASFRDPSGFLFYQEGVLYRQINPHGIQDYHQLMDSGLYADLIQAGLLIPHTEVTEKVPPSQPQALVIQPERIPFISYPYEWCFSQLKEAALTTLQIELRALQHGMSLKDSSAYNIQFFHGKPVLIDTLSFEPYREGEPWDAYRQYCQHFLAPLALMAYTDIRLSQLLRVYIDGIPLDLASKLLPRKTRYNFGLSVHLHLHARSQKKYADKEISPDMRKQKISQMQFMGLVNSMISATRKLVWQPSGTDWADYELIHNYNQAAKQSKQQIVSTYLDQISPQIVWDLGANTGQYSRIASQRGAYTVAFDMDASAVEQNYQTVRREREQNLLPLLLDLTNPSPELGWQNRERRSMLERGPVDAILALALIHHLAIGNNVPLSSLSEFFSSLSQWLIVEFIPKEDSQVQKLLRARQDIFPEYTLEVFERAFSHDFEIIDRQLVTDSLRTLFLLRNRQPFTH